jgi:hypothetical protein
MARTTPNKAHWILMLAATALSSCQTVSYTPPPQEERSVLDPASATARRNLVITTQSLTRVPGLGPVGNCQYLSSYSFSDHDEKRSFTQRISSVRSSPGRLLITLDYGGTISTAIIGTDGRIFDFNMAAANGARWTSDTYSQQARQTAARDGTQGEVINNFTIAHPRYLQSTWQPGSTVATILAEDGTIWGSMLYRGSSSYNGHIVAVLDIIKERPIDTYDVGFSLIDTTNFLPVLVAVRSHYNLWRLEQISCS